MKNLLIILLLVPLIFFGQNKKNDTIHQTQNIKFNFKSVIIPSVLIGYGIIGVDNDALKRFNYEIQEGLLEQPHNEIKIDDVSQHVPSLAVYGLNALGIKGKNNFKEEQIHKSSFLKLKKIVMKKFPKLKLEFHIMKLS